jgi:hypothetical protein
LGLRKVRAAALRRRNVPNLDRRTLVPLLITLYKIKKRAYSALKPTRNLFVISQLKAYIDDQFL